MMYSWGGPPWGRAKIPAAMTVVNFGGSAILFEPLGNDDAKRAALRGALGRRLEARRRRNLKGRGR